MATANPMVPTISAPNGMSYEQSLYWGAAAAQLGILRNQMTLGGLNVGSRRVELANGVVIEAEICFNQQNVRVVLPIVSESNRTKTIIYTIGFAVHPRNSHFVDGFDFSKPSNGSYLPLNNSNAVFPLVDDDHGTVMMMVQDDTVTSAIPASDNYGVHHWQGETGVVSWSGYPAIALGADRSAQISGLTNVDSITEYATYFTPLRNQYYYNGEAVPAPGRVRGAGMSKRGIVIVATINYQDGDGIGYPNPVGQDWMYDNGATSIPEGQQSGKIGGYYDELYLQSDYALIVNGRVATSSGGWVRVGYASSDVNNLPVWFDDDAMSAVSENVLLSWLYTAITNPVEITTPWGDKVTPVATVQSTLTKRPESPQQFITVTPIINTMETDTGVVATRSRSAGAGWGIGYMLHGSAMLNTSISDVTDSDYNNTSKSEDVPIKYEKRPDPVNYGIWIELSPLRPDGIPAYGYNLGAHDFKLGPYTWETTLGEIVQLNPMDFSAYLDLTDVCGFATVTVTDACGFSAELGGYDLKGELSEWGFTDCVEMATSVNCPMPMGGWLEYSGPGYPEYLEERGWVSQCPENMIYCTPLSVRTSIFGGECNDHSPILDFQVSYRLDTWVCEPGECVQA